VWRVGKRSTSFGKVTQAAAAPRSEDAVGEPPRLGHLEYVGDAPQPAAGERRGHHVTADTECDVGLEAVDDLKSASGAGG